jgi:hypothetical protein
MPRISLWKPTRDNDYSFNDRTLKDYYLMGGTGVYVHKYEGPLGGGDETTIEDVLFLEISSRKYSEDVYELRGVYQPQASDFNLSQFGIFLSNDTVFITFHYADMLAKIGRKLMSGDVIELPHLADPDTLDEDMPATKRLYVIEDAAHDASGYGVKWWSHIWRIKAKMITDSPEFSGGSGGILVDEDGNPVNPDGTPVQPGQGPVEVCDDCNTLPISSVKDRLLEITDANLADAIDEVKFDPKWFDAEHLWALQGDDGTWYLTPWSGSGNPPNGQPLAGAGFEFPATLVDGDFFLRTDYVPNRMFQKQGTVFKRVWDDMRIRWTATNKVIDQFIYERGTDIMSDGTEQNIKTAISKAVKPKVNLQEDKLNEIYGDYKKGTKK